MDRRAPTLLRACRTGTRGRCDRAGVGSILRSRGCPRRGRAPVARSASRASSSASSSGAHDTASMSTPSTPPARHASARLTRRRGVTPARVASVPNSGVPSSDAARRARSCSASRARPPLPLPVVSSQARWAASIAKVGQPLDADAAGGGRFERQRRGTAHLRQWWQRRQRPQVTRSARRSRVRDAAASTESLRRSGGGAALRPPLALARRARKAASTASRLRPRTWNSSKGSSSSTSATR